MNHGIRISAPGKDVWTCSDLDTVVNSKYALLKGSLSGSGSIVNNGSEVKTATIAHNLGYIPFAQVYTRFSDETFWSECPIYASGLGVFKGVSHYCDSTNLTIKTEQSGEVSRTFYYQYFIYLDKGKL